MFFNIKTFTVYRKGAITGGWSTPAWTNVGTVRGTLSPISGSDEIRNAQEFADVRQLITAELTYKDSVLDKDELVGPDGSRYRVRLIQVYDNVLPHLAIYVANVQWESGAT